MGNVNWRVGSPDLIPLWVAALHGHVLGSEPSGRDAPPHMLNNPFMRAYCTCGWTGTQDSFEEYEDEFRYQWNEHVLYEIAIAVRV